MSVLNMYFIFCLFSDKKRLLVVTVATNATDGFNRYMRSAKKNGLNVKVGNHDGYSGGQTRSSVGHIEVTSFA